MFGLSKFQEAYSTDSYQAWSLSNSFSPIVYSNVPLFSTSTVVVGLIDMNFTCEICFTENYLQGRKKKSTIQFVPLRHILRRKRRAPKQQHLEHAMYNPQLDQKGHANKAQGNSSRLDPEINSIPQRLSPTNS